MVRERRNSNSKTLPGFDPLAGLVGGVGRGEVCGGGGGRFFSALFSILSLRVKSWEDFACVPDPLVVKE